MSISRLYRYCVAALLILGSVSFPPAASTVRAQDTRFSIQKTHGSRLNSTVEVAVYLATAYSDTVTIGRFDLRMTFDPDAMTPVDVTVGDSLAAHQWGNFVWAVGADANCGDILCGDSIIRVRAGTGGGGEPITVPGSTLDKLELFRMYFQTSADTTSYDCSFWQIRFVWFLCTDNIAATAALSDTLLASDGVYFYTAFQDSAHDAPLPTLYGAPDSCIAGGVNDKTVIRAMDFYGGGIDFRCVDSVDDRGDIDVDGNGYTIFDYSLFARVFLEGPAVLPFGSDEYGKTDCNANQVDLELDDLTFMAGVILGELMPFPRPNLVTDTAVIRQDHNNRVITIEYPGDLRNVWMVFGGDVGSVTSPDSIFAVTYDSTYSRLLTVMELDNWNRFVPDTIVDFYSGDAPLVYAEVSSDGTASVPVRLERINVPPCCELRGDVNGKLGPNVSDIAFLVSFLFRGAQDIRSKPLPLPCEEEANIDGTYNGGSAVSVADLVYLVDFLFRDGPPPPPCP